MKDLSYSQLVAELKDSRRPCIVVVDTLYHNKRSIAQRLQADAGITPVYPRLNFGPTDAQITRRQREMEKRGDFPVMFCEEYPLAIHWERAFPCYQLVNDKQQSIFDRIQKENDWVRSAPTKAEQHQRGQQLLDNAFGELGKTMGKMAEESRLISKELDEKAARIIETQDKAGFEQLKQDYSKESITRRFLRRVFGGKA
ncbi:hypothetical protein [Enterobacter roggenkampii]|uniref:hypothetical protein n=1 Tax=Enterobacter roggenkampii TaxID=1812935 RepID=UPI003EBE50B5